VFWSVVVALGSVALEGCGNPPASGMSDARFVETSFAAIGDAVAGAPTSGVIPSPSRTPDGAIGYGDGVSVQIDEDFPDDSSVVRVYVPKGKTARIPYLPGVLAEVPIPSFEWISQPIAGGGHLVRVMFSEDIPVDNLTPDNVVQVVTLSGDGQGQRFVASPTGRLVDRAEGSPFIEITAVEVDFEAHLRALRAP